MKNGKAIFLSAAVILGATGLIAGNHVLASNALAAGGTNEPAIIMPESASAIATQLSGVGMYANSDGVIYLAPANHSEDVQKQEEAPAFDEASPDVEGRKNTMVVSGSADDPFKQGTPLDSEIASDKAQELAVAAIVDKYALTQETLDMFTVTAIYFEVHPDAPDSHIWRVDLNPTNTDDFSEIGCYSIYIDAETGLASNLKSAANGVG